MGIQPTDEWLEKDLYHPEKLFRNITAEEENPEALYQYLLRFGMYRPGRLAKEIYEELVKKEIWKRTKNIFDHYRKMWDGPDIPVYIFPKRRFMNEIDPDKSGISFKDKMFLFLHDVKQKKELEALIVHEYHHVCRLNRISKPMHDYSLLDSMVIEGLAEFAVTKYCGENYNAKWTSAYPKEELSYYWEKYAAEHLTVTRTSPLHDRLLFGLGRYPSMLGYALGYYLVMSQKNSKNWTIHDTFIMKAEEMDLSF